jgi:hypothetical protein
VFDSCRSSGNNETDAELWRQVREEVGAGWLSDPMSSIDEVKQILGPFVLARRFPLLQKGKFRPIDDLNEANTNLAFGYEDKLSFHDVDVIAATVNAILMLTSRTTQSHEWNGKLTFLGRALDLKKAYKQWAVAEEHLWSSVIAVWDPIEKKPKLMIQYTLPFGAKASVFFFNRLSRLFRLILARLLKLVVLCFYDDFPFFEPKATSSLVRKVSECCLAALQ